MASELYMRRTLKGFICVDAAGEELISDYPVGEVVKCTIRKPRNAKFHRKWMALVQVVFAQQDYYPTFDLFRRAIQRSCGFVEIINGREFDISISWTKMDDKSFEILFEKTLVIIENHILPGINRDEVTEKYLEILKGYSL